MDFKNDSNNLHKCDLCPYGTKSLQIFTSHCDLHKQRPPNYQFQCHSKPPRTYICNSCNFKTGVRMTLMHHLKTSHNRGNQDYLLNCYNCEECKLQTFSLLVLVKHWFKCHGGNETIRSIGKGLNWLLCDQCVCWCKNDVQLRRHQRKKHRLSGTMKRTKQQEDLLRCVHWNCEFKTKSEDLLKQHVLKNHFEVKWFKCGQCGFQTRKEEDMQTHLLRIHVPVDTLLRCICCSYRADNRSLLMAHMELNHPTLHRCDQCDFQTEKRHFLGIHMDIKHALKCVYCSYLPTNKSALVTHLEKVHGLYICEHCTFRTKARSIMVNHMSTYHPSSVYIFSC